MRERGKDTASSPASLLDTLVGDVAAVLAGHWQHCVQQQREQGNGTAAGRAPKMTWAAKPFASSVFTIQRVKFQPMCGPERLSNRSCSTGAPGQQVAQLSDVQTAGWDGQGETQEALTNFQELNEVNFMFTR